MCKVGRGEADFFLTQLLGDPGAIHLHALGGVGTAALFIELRLAELWVHVGAEELIRAVRYVALLTRAAGTCRNDVFSSPNYQ